MNTGEETRNQEQPLKAESGNQSEDQMKALKQLTDHVKNLELKLAEKEASGGKISAMDVASIAAVINEAKKLTKGDENIDYNAGIDVKQIPVDDHDPKGVRFACPFAGYYICDDVRKGHIVKLPYGKKGIFFEYVNTRRVSTGKFDQITPIAIYESHSKAEIEWLRGHSLYGAFFYESTRGVTDADASKAARMAGVLQALQNLELQDVLRRAREYGVPLTEDAQQMKVNIAFKMVQAEIDFAHKRSLESLEETYKSNLLLSSKG